MRVISVSNPPLIFIMLTVFFISWSASANSAPLIWGAGNWGDTWNGPDVLYDTDGDASPDTFDIFPFDASLKGVNGAVASDDLGSSVSYVGDINNDGYGDYIVGAYLHDVGALKDAGSAQIISGKTSQVLFTFNGDIAKAYFGFSVAGVGDVDGDGTPDVAVGAYNDNAIVNGVTLKGAGSVTVYSGINGNVLYKKYGDQAKEYFGYSVAGVHDVDGDGHDDIVVGAPLADSAGLKDAGKIQILIGAAGTLYRTYSGDAAGDNLGKSVAYAGDINHDGFGDVIVGAPLSDNNGLKDSGYARIYSPHTDVVLRTLSGAHAGDNFGSSVSTAGDVNKDGTDDVIIGAYKEDVTNSVTLKLMKDAGTATVYSGVNGGVIYQFKGVAAQDYFGFAVSNAGDINNDGYADVIVGSYAFDPLPQGATKVLKDAGKVAVYSGKDDSTLFNMSGTGVGDYFGWSVSSGDTNNDGVPDILVGVIKDDVGAAKDAGSVIVISGATVTP